MQNLAGRTAFVTGSAGGIGFAIAQALAGEGMNLALADIDEGRLVEAAGRIGTTGVKLFTTKLDVSDYADWERAIDAAEAALGPVALLVNNAGIGGGGNLVGEDPARWRRVMEVNAIGPFNGCRAMLARMTERGEEAHIVNIASLSGLRSNPGMSSYNASKFAVVGMSDTLRQELTGTPIGLSVVYPGMTNTHFVENSQRQIARETHAVVDRNSGVGNMLASGMNPDKLAARVVRGIKANEYHIFTHADWKPMIQAVFDERIAAFGENADPDYRENIEALQARVASTQDAAKAH